MHSTKRRINPVKFFRMISVTLLIAAAVFFFSFKSSASGLTSHSYTEVTVGAGDTLWQIADMYNEEENIQKVIFDIMEYNNMQNVSIYPGQILKIPAKN